MSIVRVPRAAVGLLAIVAAGACHPSRESPPSREQPGVAREPPAPLASAPPDTALAAPYADSEAPVTRDAPPADPDTIPGAPPVTALPAGFADLPKATVLEIKDEWNGMGQTHDLFARLERLPAGKFAVRAKIVSYAGSLGERVADPTSPRSKWGEPCPCAIEQTCRCEASGAQPLRKHATVDAAPIDTFLRAVAHAGLDPKQDYRTGMTHTDDYPKAHVLVVVPAAPDAIHLSLLDNQRHWRVDGAFLGADPEDHAGDHQPETWQKSINVPYQTMLDALGLHAWMKELAKRAGGRVPRGL
jgi:hypothetical protein